MERPERRRIPGYSSPRPADVAQLVEHFTRNEGVRGSSPRVGSASSGASTSATQLGLLQSITTHGLTAVTSYYDSAGRPVRTVNGKGSSYACYDAEGDLLATLAPGDSQPTTRTYDPAGRLLASAHAGSTDDTLGTVANTYDEAGRITSTTDANGATAIFRYDARRQSADTYCVKCSLGRDLRPAPNLQQLPDHLRLQRRRPTHRRNLSCFTKSGSGVSVGLLVKGAASGTSFCFLY